MTIATDPNGSPDLSPNDEVALMLSLLRPIGVSMARRWLAALVMVPPDEQADVVADVEARIVEIYASQGMTPPAPRPTRPAPDPDRA